MIIILILIEFDSIMYVCICNAVTERDIRHAADNGARNVRQLGAQLGVATGCGGCAAHATSILREHSAATDRLDGSGADPCPVPA